MLSERRSLMEELAWKGVRLTAQRRVLIETLQESTQHLDAASLLALARKREPRLDRATVYRTIDKLKSMGLIDELDLMHMEGEKHYYEVKPRRDHVHLACFQCGGVQEFSTPLFEELKNVITQQMGFDVTLTRLEVGGTCANCRGKNAVERPPRRQKKGTPTGVKDERY